MAFLFYLEYGLVISFASFQVLGATSCLCFGWFQGGLGIKMKACAWYFFIAHASRRNFVQAVLVDFSAFGVTFRTSLCMSITFSHVVGVYFKTYSLLFTLVCFGGRFNSTIKILFVQILVFV